MLIHDDEDLRQSRTETRRWSRTIACTLVFAMGVPESTPDASPSQFSTYNRQLIVATSSSVTVLQTLLIEQYLLQYADRCGLYALLASTVMEFVPCPANRANG